MSGETVKWQMSGKWTRNGRKPWKLTCLHCLHFYDHALDIPKGRAKITFPMTASTVCTIADCWLPSKSVVPWGCEHSKTCSEHVNINYMFEGSLEVKLPTIWTDEKQSRAEAERRERLEERRSEKRKSQKKEDADARKGRKVAKHCVFPMICGSGGSNRREMKNCTPLWREAHFEVKMYKTHHSRTTFGGSDVEKVSAVVARSTFRSQNVQNTPLSDNVGMSKKCLPLWHEAHFQVKKVQNTSASDHFWKLKSRKSARRCGAKHISKSKCTKHHMCAPLLEVQMSKKCTRLWREAHFEVKMLKKHKGFGPLLEVQMSLRFTTLHYTTLHYTALHYTIYTTLHNTTTTQLHSTTLHYTPLHSTTLHSTTLHYTPLH